MMLPPAKPRKPELDVDGNDLTHLAWLRVHAKSEHFDLPHRAACMDALPKDYRIKLPMEVDMARQQYLSFLEVEKQGTG